MGKVTLTIGRLKAGSRSLVKLRPVLSFMLLFSAAAEHVSDTLNKFSENVNCRGDNLKLLYWLEVGLAIGIQYLLR